MLMLAPMLMLMLEPPRSGSGIRHLVANLAIARRSHE